MDRYIPVRCMIREEGCRSMVRIAKLKRRLRSLTCKNCRKEVSGNQLGVVGYRFLKKVPSLFYCDQEYEKDEGQ